ncbi:MAG: XRE family transcriptional regulator [Deltaproteobacteria bacterium]|nr:XRE family transcriptional regulator [Deltaproteobacteria bacterium]
MPSRCSCLNFGCWSQSGTAPNALDLRRYIQGQGWTQAEAATFFAETQPRISNLLKGEISRFSIDKLINLLARAGLVVHVETKLKAA